METRRRQLPRNELLLGIGARPPCYSLEDALSPCLKGLIVLAHPTKNCLFLRRFKGDCLLRRSQIPSLLTFCRTAPSVRPKLKADYSAGRRGSRPPRGVPRSGRYVVPGHLDQVDGAAPHLPWQAYGPRASSRRALRHPCYHARPKERAVFTTWERRGFVHERQTTTDGRGCAGAWLMRPRTSPSVT